MTARSRRRVAWRKGTGVDEELWPAEEFGGVSDEQFWNDLAADRPLATTARTAQPDTAARRLPPDARPRGRTRSPARGRIPDPQPGDPARQAAGRVAGDGAGTHPQPRLGPDDRTAVQPAVAAMPPSPGPARPVRAAYQAAPVPSPAATGAQEDPLTSPAYALRPKGAVDGRSPQSSRHSMDANGGDTGRRRPGRAGLARSRRTGPGRVPRRPAARSRARPTGRYRRTATVAARPTCTSSSLPGSRFLRAPRRTARGSDTRTRPGRPARPAPPGMRTAAGTPARRAATATRAGVVRPTRPPAATARLTSRGATTAGNQSGSASRAPWASGGRAGRCEAAARSRGGLFA